MLMKWTRTDRPLLSSPWLSHTHHSHPNAAACLAKLAHVITYSGAELPVDVGVGRRP